MTMRNAQHEIQKSKWRNIIHECQQSGKTVRSWCLENNVRQNRYYYWLKIVREESLIQAGTLAVTQSNRFVELMPKNSKSDIQASSLCAKLTTDNGCQMDIYNGADEQTLGLLLRMITSQC